MISTGIIILLQLFKPLKENADNNKETFNEYGTLVFIILLQCMSDFVPDLEMRQQVGTTYIVWFCLFAFIHLLLMLAVVGRPVRLRCKRCYNRCCRQRRNTRRNKKRNNRIAPAIVSSEADPASESAVNEKSKNEESKNEDFNERA